MIDKYYIRRVAKRYWNSAYLSKDTKSYRQKRRAEFLTENGVPLDRDGLGQWLMLQTMVNELQEKPNKTILWTWDESDHALAVELGMYDSQSFEYHTRELAMYCETLERNGMKYEVITVSPLEMLAKLKEFNKPNTPEHRADCAIKIYEERKAAVGNKEF
jgi:hypothetical protein